MEKSPLQLMARMASVVKGQYQETTQMDDVVEPNDEDQRSSPSEPHENTLIAKKEQKESQNNR